MEYQTLVTLLLLYILTAVDIRFDVLADSEGQDVCNPPCENKGRCVGDNKCMCATEFAGHRCERASCQALPYPSLHMLLRCRDEDTKRSSCEARCEDGYQFPGSVKKMKHVCYHETNQWKPKFEFPECEKSCQDPPSPLNGKSSCIKFKHIPNRIMCTAECDSGYSFPHKGKKERNTCDLISGEWTPTYEFQTCELSCNPPCENGGSCTLGNKCLCLPEFTGERCQYISRDKIKQGSCEDPPTPINGSLSCKTCEMNPDKYSCQAKCDPGYQFPNSEEEVINVCDLNTGEWKPKFEFPDCKQSSNISLPRERNGNPLLCSTDFLQNTAICYLLENAIQTFDGSFDSNEICNHVLMKEKSERYSVTVHKTCSSEALDVCDRYLVINIHGISIKIGPSVDDVSIKNTRVDANNLWLVSQRFQDFEVAKKGMSLVFKSLKYNFEVTWNKGQDASITVSKCLLNDIFGLCGFHNRGIRDDGLKERDLISSRKKENGTFGATESSEKCMPTEYAAGTFRIAIDICVKLRAEPFKSCFEHVEMRNRVDACIRNIRKCLQRSTEPGAFSDALYNNLNVKKCKCQAYENFVGSCRMSEQESINDWRIQYDCPPTCPKGMEWKDCGPGCELTCDNFHHRSKLCTSKCIPGCYCPEGLIRHKSQCVKPDMCQDCVCRGFGDSNYITFDGRDYSFRGNCTYILAQHQTSEYEDHNFRILGTNVDCPDESNTTCIRGLSIFWKGHNIKKQKNQPVYLNQTLINPQESPLEVNGIVINYIPNKSTVVHIKAINLVVRYFDDFYGFIIELPSFYYNNKTEGLCGVCSFVESNDLYHRDGYVTSDIDDFAYSWLEESETREICKIPQAEILDPPTELCNFTGNPCQVIFDSFPYEKSCLNDIKYSAKPEISSCRSKFQYAQKCCERGVSLVDWLKLSGCGSQESSCPDGMIYGCTSSCPKVCENYETYDEDGCPLMPMLTCVCPEGEVLTLGKCVKPVKCKTCDDEGHVLGDMWKIGPCWTCSCSKVQVKIGKFREKSLLTTNCMLQRCPKPPVCVESETLLTLNFSDDICCKTYVCHKF